MKHKTQMMKIRSPELFYLFRRALGLFLLFALSFSDAQINLIGNAVVIDHSQDSEIYVAAGTYVHNLDTARQSKTVGNSGKHIRTISKRKHLPLKLLSVKKEAAKPSFDYHFNSGKTPDQLTSAADLKIVCLNNSNDHYKDHLALIVEWYSAHDFPHSVSESLSSSTDRKNEYFHHQFRTRPPPTY